MSSTDREQADAARYGAHRVIVKPFDLEELLEAIRQGNGLA